MRRKEFAARIWAKLISSQRAHRLLADGDRILIAVSGGPDSVCLAHYLAEQRRRKDLALFILHAHHGLRGRLADRDQAFVRKLGRRLDIAVKVVRLAVAKKAAQRRKGLEDAGRYLRYRALARTARRLKCNKVATGHHLDDQAETVLLNILRGTRLSGLRGIPRRRALAPGIELIRPLLALARKDIEAYLRIHGLEYRLDRSNYSPAFTRNWIRTRALPLLEKKQPRIREHLAGLAEQVRGITDI